MPKAIPRGPLIEIQGIEPNTDPAWALAGPRGHKAFYTETMNIALAVKDKSLSKGLDIYGDKMQIKESTRRNRQSAMGPAYYRAPALTPSFEASRTRSYLRGEASTTGVTLWWKYDNRLKVSWGKILEYQRDTPWEVAPNGRNVIGMSADDLDKIFAHMQKWWRVNRVRLAQRGFLASGAIGFGSSLSVTFPASIVQRAPEPIRQTSTVDVLRGGPGAATGLFARGGNRGKRR